MKNCSNCVYMDVTIIQFEDVDGETPHSICRRFPPQMIAIEESASTYWPLVHDEEWCGEWAQSESTSQESQTL